MTTKKTQIQNPFQVWEDYTRSFTELVVESTQRTLDQNLALGEQMSSIWLDAAKRTQELAVKEGEAALQLVESAQAEVKAAGDRAIKMVQNFSAS